ncbi:amidase [Chitinasiproducens palmae]|uniref:Amidase n=1 Tax=Chitinasiproducens palmae TaxID=1770053 RepID=A0A1H2PPY3_9BURK|nr:amidase [Chitinasiproducens palmae]SDV48846.1 amidase [Chitinasiproducens palmae]
MNRAGLLAPGLHGAFVADGFGRAPDAALAAGARLAGKRLAVKDVFDIAGLRTGSGNPTWRAQQPVAGRTALAVAALLAEGATWVGKTVTDELTYSLAGVNAHYGTPTNPADPTRIPGGSSSGSAVAVAAGHADIGLGTDCGGSVRLPASYCGIWGMRPSHGRIAGDGCLTLAHSFDTVGWFARDADTLAEVFAVLARVDLSPTPASALAGRLAVPRHLLDCVDARVAAAFDAWLPTLPVAVSRLAQDVSLAEWAQAFRVLQASEIAQRYGAWFRAHHTAFGPDVGTRFAAALDVTSAQVARAQLTRRRASAAMSEALSDGRYWLMPTVPDAAPRLDEPPSSVEGTRARAQQMLCVAGLAGLPQVSMPWLTLDGAPLGVSLIGARGDDEGVLAAAVALHAGYSGVA